MTPQQGTCSQYHLLHPKIHCWKIPKHIQSQALQQDSSDEYFYRISTRDTTKRMKLRVVPQFTLS